MSKFHNAPNRSKPVEDAFREKYLPDPQTGCWVWKASFMKTGYGQFNPRNGKTVTAHRFSYQLHKGEIPKGLFVCHTCDNRACVNPKHLWLGTNAENLKDMREKGRAKYNPPIGERNHSAKITEKQAAEIFKSKLPVRKLAERFKLSEAAIHAIQTGKTWKHVTKDLGSARRVIKKKITPEDACKIFLDNRNQTVIASEYGVQPNLISRIKSAKRHAEATKNLRESVNA